MSDQSGININNPIMANKSRIYAVQSCYGPTEKTFFFARVDMVITISIILGMVLLTGLCCLCMKISDLKMRRYIIKTANERGLKVDMDKLDPKTYCSPKDDTCTIMVPNVCISI